MPRPVPVAETGHTSLSLYRRPSRLRRIGALLLTAGGALAVACGGGGDNKDDPGQVWVETDGASGRINLDDVQQAYRESYSADKFEDDKFEKRVNEIYEGDGVVLLRVEREGDKVLVSGWEDLNGNKQLDPDADDKLFTITQDLRDGGGYQTQGHGANGYYNNSSPFGGFFTGMLLGSLLSGGRNTYITSPGRYDDINSSRSSYRNGSGYASQRGRNESFGNSAGSRFGNAASQGVSPARSSYQQRQISSGGFRSSGSSSRSIGTGVKGGGTSGGGISGGGGILTY